MIELNEKQNRLSDNLRKFLGKFSEVFENIRSLKFSRNSGFRVFSAYDKFRVASSRVKSAPENILFQRFFAQKRDHGAHDLYERRLF